jgi:hypothetical protein
MTTARFVRVGKMGTDYVWLHDGDDCLRVNFADDWMFTKEERAACFRGKEGKTVAIPLDGQFFIGIDILLGEFEGSVRVIPSNFPIASIERF